MADSALGSALVIPESALKKIKEADDKLKQLQRTAEQTASSVKSSFGTMQGSTTGFIGALDQIIQKLGTINNASSKMSGSLSNIGANKASKDVSQMNGVIIQASENIDRMVASQRKATNSADFSKSVSDWQNIQAQIDATNKRQQELTQSMRQYEMVQKNIRDGKGGIVYKDDKIAYAANQKEFESNQQLIASLREKQQAIIANNQALNQQIQLLNSLKNYHIESGSLDNLRSKDTLASMREYYKEQEKLSAQQEKQRQKDANNWLKNKEKEAQAAEKASRREQEASDKAAAKAEKDASRIRAAQEKAYMKDWLKQQRSAFYSNTNAVIADTNGAKTLRDHIAAVKELQQARLSLNTTDKNYKQNLASVNEAIKQHSKVLKEAGVNAKNLGEQTSYIAGYLSRLAQRTAVVFSFGAAKSFVEQIAEVRGQFELSERSLEAILQNKPKADEIFNKTVELAVKSPFRIKDLVDYTRQLSAYRIESDKLYNTTKRLADVSAGLGVDTDRTAATMATGTEGIFHGMKSYFCQDEFGQIAPVYSISAGLDYPGVGPEHAYLKDIGRAEYVPVTDEEAVNAFEYIAKEEGIIAAIESSHAVAHLMKIAPTMSKDQIIICCLSGRGDKDVAAIARYRGIDLHE